MRLLPNGRRCECCDALVTAPEILCRYTTKDHRFIRAIFSGVPHVSAGSEVTKWKRGAFHPTYISSAAIRIQCGVVNHVPTVESAVVGGTF